MLTNPEAKNLTSKSTDNICSNVPGNTPRNVSNNTNEQPDYFVVGDRVIVPLQGVGLVADQEIRHTDGVSYTCFKILLGNSLAILVPKEGITTSGVRLPMSQKQATSVLKRLSVPSVYRQPRKARLKDCQEKAKKGDSILLAEITRDLGSLARSGRENLSTKEKELLAKVENILAEELSLVQGTSKYSALMEIRSLIENNTHSPEIVTLE